MHLFIYFRVTANKLFDLLPLLHQYLSTFLFLHLYRLKTMRVTKGSLGFLRGVTEDTASFCKNNASNLKYYSESKKIVHFSTTYLFEFNSSHWR